MRDNGSMPTGLTAELAQDNQDVAPQKSEPTNEQGSPIANEKPKVLTAEEMDREYDIAAKQFLDAGWQPMDDNVWNQFTQPGAEFTTAILGIPQSDGVVRGIWSPSKQDAPTGFFIAGDRLAADGQSPRKVYQRVAEPKDGPVWREKTEKF